jgi:predicted nucleotidyltransferase
MKFFLKVKKIIKPISSSKPVIRILIEGSAARRELGKYVKPKHGIMPYSDVDVLVVAKDKIKLPKSFIEDYNLPEKIKKRTKQICYRYVYKHKIEGKIPLHVPVFNKNVHNKELALKSGLNVDWPTKNKVILLYKKK